MIILPWPDKRLTPNAKRRKHWRTMTADEYYNACEDAYTAQFEGEPPLSAQERHEIAGRQKHELRR